jgi:hypothetical protein
VDLTDTSLFERARAARELVRWGRIEGDLALSYVIWPELCPSDVGKPFAKIQEELDPSRCRAITRAATFPARCKAPALEDGLCGRHLRHRREGRPLLLYEEAA